MQKEKIITSLDGQSTRMLMSEPQKEEEKERGGKKNSPALFCQHTGCVSKLCAFQDVTNDVVKDTPKAEDKESSHHLKQNGSPVSIPIAMTTVTPSSSTHNTSQRSSMTTPSTVAIDDTTPVLPSASTSTSSSSSLLSPPVTRESPGNTPPTSSPYIPFLPNDQLLRVLTERSGHWFSLLPRTPCDLSSLTTPPPGAPRTSSISSSTPARPRSPPPSPALPLTPSAASASASPHHPAGLLNYPLSALQVRLLAWRETPVERIVSLI